MRIRKIAIALTLLLGTIVLSGCSHSNRTSNSTNKITTNQSLPDNRTVVNSIMHSPKLQIFFQAPIPLDKDSRPGSVYLIKNDRVAELTVQSDPHDANGRNLPSITFGEIARLKTTDKILQRLRKSYGDSWRDADTSKVGKFTYSQKVKYALDTNHTNNKTKSITLIYHFSEDPAPSDNAHYISFYFPAQNQQLYSTHFAGYVSDEQGGETIMTIVPNGKTFYSLDKKDKKRFIVNPNYQNYK
ncbi:hypothetical protein KGS74_03070 [Lacticaseibacillus casei]|uniref:hypothetical protein n=1 Tax=Lacticaseibacillus TaxID=2759736 RepID=UPI000668E1EE|nr:MULTISPECIES: hypothetical protein [Lacticaseibacillus]QVI37977.1 hypothetical protein KGS74_03070 [Lacticaseibacillus casei]WFB43162.1 hypothetical protein LHUE2_001233 [Lacticaseibacillus huelsenbergensis]